MVKDELFLKLYQAYLNARLGGKRWTYDEHKFEDHEFENLIKIRDSLMNKTYHPSRGVAFIVREPVQREIFAAPFSDRVVHHFIYNEVADWWDRRFIYDSYSCRKGKGTLMGILRLSKHIQKVSDNYNKKTWVIKLDIQGYFTSIPRKQLYDRAIWGLDRQFKEDYGWLYEILKYAWKEVIMDDPCKNVRRRNWPEDWIGLPESKSLFRQSEGVGVVIGNLTSQLLSNIYLDQLDRYVKYDLGWKHYGRYVDDFYLVVRDEDLARALEDVKKIQQFLRRIGLTLHPKKRVVQPIEKGVEFLGVVVYPGRIIPGQRVIKNAREGFSEVVAGVRGIETVASYMGHLKYMNSQKALSELFERVGWKYNW